MDAATITLTVAGLLAKKALEATGRQGRRRGWGTRPPVLVVGVDAMPPLLDRCSSNLMLLQR
jgi:hypothetical protein